MNTVIPDKTKYILSPEQKQKKKEYDVAYRKKRYVEDIDFRNHVKTLRCKYYANLKVKRIEHYDLVLRLKNDNEYIN